MMAIRPLAAGLIITLLLCGCTRTVSRPELEVKAAEHNGFTFPDRLYYCGSKGGYDYFVIRNGFSGSSSHYRVLQLKDADTNSFAFTKDETRWLYFGFTTNGQHSFTIVTNQIQK